MLSNIMYITYLVPAWKLRHFLPDHIQLDLVGSSVFVSIVTFRVTHLGFADHAFVPFQFSQLNIRTYVRDMFSGQAGPYYLNCAVSSELILRLAQLSGYQWEPLTMRHAGINVIGHVDYLQPKKGGFIFELSPNGKDEKEMTAAEKSITDSSVAYFPNRFGTIVVRMRHEYEGANRARAKFIRFAALSSLGIVEADEIERPHSILLFEKALFIMNFPGQRSISEPSYNMPAMHALAA